MTLASELARQRYEGNGSTYIFSTGFVFQDNSHVRIVFTATNGTESDWTENTQYTLVGADTGSAGTITVITTPTDYTPQADEFITILRDVPFTQDLNGGIIETMSSEDQEHALDKIWMGLGQLKEVTSRAVLTAEGGSGDASVVTAWSPLLAVVSDGARRVLQVAGWEGGSGTEPDSGQYVGATGLVDSIGDGVDIRGTAGASGIGAGDMLAANNLDDVISAATAFSNIKQAATTSATGVSELATDAEAQAKADTARTLTPSNLASLGATTTFAGLAELATDAEAITGSDTVRTVTPHALTAALAAYAASFGFPSGTVMLFMQTAAPTGWTKSTTHNDKALRIVSGTASSGGSVNFSTLFGRTGTDAVTLIQANLPNVNLNGTVTFATPAGGNFAAAGGDVAPAGSGTTDVVSLGGSGTSFTPAIDMRVKYADIIAASKD